MPKGRICIADGFGHRGRSAATPGAGLRSAGLIHPRHFSTTFAVVHDWLKIWRRSELRHVSHSGALMQYLAGESLRGFDGDATEARCPLLAQSENASVMQGDTELHARHDSITIRRRGGASTGSNRGTGSARRFARPSEHQAFMLRMDQLLEL